MRGVPVDSALAPTVIATVHPSSILRAPDEEARREAMRAFVDDLRVVAGLPDVSKQSWLSLTSSAARGRSDFLGSVVGAGMRSSRRRRPPGRRRRGSCRRGAGAAVRDRRPARTRSTRVRAKALERRSCGARPESPTTAISAARRSGGRARKAGATRPRGRALQKRMREAEDSRRPASPARRRRRSVPGAAGRRRAMEFPAGVGWSSNSFRRATRPSPSRASTKKPPRSSSAKQLDHQVRQAAASSSQRRSPVVQ